MSVVARLKRMSDQHKPETMPNDMETTKVVREIYNAYVQTADAISERRYKLNTYFLSINSAILGGSILSVSILGTSVAAAPIVPRPTTQLGIAGLFLTLAWLSTLRSYRRINAAKFRVIVELERNLPATPFTDEWEVLASGSRRERYFGLTRIEYTIPIVFLVLHAISLTSGTNWAALPWRDWISELIQLIQTFKG
jgi:hypothetical protein